jgi:hypothetical protein
MPQAEWNLFPLKDVHPFSKRAYDLKTAVKER